MFKNKYIKFSVSFFLVLMALWVATPKVYIHDLLHHDHSSIQVSAETKVNSESTDDCDFEEYNKPVYFSIFKFICSFIPSRPQHSGRIIEQLLDLNNISCAVSLLRGPPVTE